MRLIFIALVVAVATMVVGAVLWPRLIDGEAAQAELRRLVEGIAGRELDVRGRVGIALLPKPRLTLTRVVLGNPLAIGGRARVEVDRVELEIAPLPFLRGRLDIRSARLIRPRLTGEPDQLRHWAAGAQALGEGPSLAGFESLQIVDGRVESLGSGLGFVAIDGIAGTLRRDQLLDRIAATLSATADGEPLQIEAEVGDLDATSPTSLRFELSAGRPGRALSAAFRGFGSLVEATPSLKGEIEIDASDPAMLARFVNAGRAAPPPVPRSGELPLHLEGRIEVAGWQRIALDGVTGQLGDNTVEINGEIALGAQPKVELTVEANEFVAEPATLGQLRRLALAVPERMAMPGRVSLRASLIRYNEQPFRQFRAALALNADGTAELERLTAVLPGGGDLSLSGRLRPVRGGLEFQGSTSLAAEDSLAVAATFGLPPESLPDETPKRFVLTGEVQASPTSLALRSFELRADGTRLSGSAALVNGRRPRLAVSAVLNRLALDRCRDCLGRLDEAWLRERLTHIDAAVDLRAERVSLGELIGSGFYMRASLEQGSVKLTELSVRDLGEARLRVVGSGDVPVASFQLAAEIEAARPALLTRAFGLALPSTTAQLAPLRLTGTARGNAQTTEVDLDLSASGVRAQASAVLGAWFDASEAGIEFKASAQRLDSLLQSFGLPAEAPALARAADLGGHLRRSGTSFALTAEGNAAPTRLRSELSLTLGTGTPSLSGSVTAATLDSALLAGALAMIEDAHPGLALAPEAMIGAVPELPLRLGSLRDISLDLGLEVQQLLTPAALPGAAVHVRIEDAQLSLADISLPLAGGRLEGVVTLDAERGYPVAGLELRLRQAKLEELAPLLRAGRIGEGEVDLGLRLAASGGDLRQMVGTLEGEGEVEIRQAGLSFPPMLPAGSDAARAQQLDGGLAVARGILTSAAPGLALAYPGGAGRVELSLDLLAWIAEAGVTLWPADLPELTTHRHLFGPPGRLQEVRPLPEAPPPGPWLP